MLISKLPDGADMIFFSILRPEYFKSKATGQILDQKKTKRKQGDGQYVPQQLKKKIAEKINTEVEQGKTAVASGSFVTIVIAKLTGGGLQTFWGMISVL